MKLSKAHKKIMAEMLIAEAKEIGLSMTLDGSWVRVTPPDKVPSELLLNLAKCGDEITEILRIEAQKGGT